jgi:hypothetical protein
MIRGTTSDRDEIFEGAAGYSFVREEGNDDILKTPKTVCYKMAFNAYRLSRLRQEQGVWNFRGRVERRTVIL